MAILNNSDRSLIGDDVNSNFNEIATPEQRDFYFNLIDTSEEFGFLYTASVDNIDRGAMAFHREWKVEAILCLQETIVWVRSDDAEIASMLDFKNYDQEKFSKATVTTLMESLEKSKSFFGERAPNVDIECDWDNIGFLHSSIEVEHSRAPEIFRLALEFWDSVNNDLSVQASKSPRLRP